MWSIFFLKVTLSFSAVHGWLSISKGVNLAMDKSKHKSKTMAVNTVEDLKFKKERKVFMVLRFGSHSE